MIINNISSSLMLLSMLLLNLLNLRLQVSISFFVTFFWAGLLLQRIWCSLIVHVLSICIYIFHWCPRLGQLWSCSRHKFRQNFRIVHCVQGMFHVVWHGLIGIRFFNFLEYQVWMVRVNSHCLFRNLFMRDALIFLSFIRTLGAHIEFLLSCVCRGTNKKLWMQLFCWRLTLYSLGQWVNIIFGL